MVVTAMVEKGDTTRMTSWHRVSERATTVEQKHRGASQNVFQILPLGLKHLFAQHTHCIHFWIVRK